MWRMTRHVSDGELLLLDEDGALSARRRSAVSRHVAACPRCASRRAELGAALAEAAAGCRETAAGTSPLHVARARLREAIELPPPRWSSTTRPWPGWPLAGRPSRLAAAAAVVAVVAAAMVLSRTADGPDPTDRPAAGAAGPLAEAAPALPGLGRPRQDRTPGPARPPRDLTAGLERPRQDLTPGSVLPVGVDEVCGGGIAAVPAVAAQVLRQVFEAYGVDYRRAAEYELDFLITPELGGAPDPRNLWPQPYQAGVWNAYVKDELERELQDLVCRGTLDLATAQQELADDWIAAYKRRFNTDRPRRDYGRTPLTPADVEAWRSELAERRLLPSGASLATADPRAAAPAPGPSRTG